MQNNLSGRRLFLTFAQGFVIAFLLWDQGWAVAHSVMARLATTSATAMLRRSQRSATGNETWFKINLDD